MRLDEESILGRLRRRTKLESSSRRIMRLVPVFIPDEFNRRRKNVCPSSSKTNYASHIVSSIKTANSEGLIEKSSGYPLFIFRLPSSDRTQISGISKKNSNYVVKPFFTIKSSSNLKNEHSNNIDKTGIKTGTLFTEYWAFCSSKYVNINFHVIPSTDFSAIMILCSCLAVSRLQSNDAWVPDLLFRDFL